MEIRNITKSVAVSRIGQRRQVVIPKRVFEALKLQEGDFVEMTAERGNLQMRPKRLVDIDVVLTPGEATKVRRGEAELHTGKSKPWRTVKHELGR
ncbi:MAG: AbrB/MazE/SpoVT family DNA-binding domain-containing protein [Terracidiphilus sp.]